MTDLREGRIQAFLDHEMDPEGRRAFMEEIARDESLRVAVEGQRKRILDVTSALDVALEVPPTSEEELAEAWEAVAGRTGISAEVPPGRSVGGAGPLKERERRGSWFAGLAPLSKAAALLLIAAGVGASTVPGSPVRGWIASLHSPPEAEVPTVSAPATGDDGQVGVRLPLDGSAFEVVLPDPLDDDLRVSLTDGESLEVLAGPGTRIAAADGRIEARDVRGPVDVRIPRRLEQVSILVSGALYLRKDGPRLEVYQAGVDTLPSEFVFAPSDSTGDAR